MVADARLALWNVQLTTHIWEAPCCALTLFIDLPAEAGQNRRTMTIIMSCCMCQLSSYVCWLPLILKYAQTGHS